MRFELVPISSNREILFHATDEELMIWAGENLPKKVCRERKKKHIYVFAFGSPIISQKDSRMTFYPVIKSWPKSTEDSTLEWEKNYTHESVGGAYAQYYLVKVNP